METGSLRFLIFMLVGVLSILRGALGIRFVIDREECLSHNVEYEGDTVHVSFVVIKADAPWHYGDDGVDLVVISLFYMHNTHTHRLFCAKFLICVLLQLFAAVMVWVLTIFCVRHDSLYL